MSDLQFQNDLEKLIAILPDKVREHITFESMTDVIEIVFGNKTVNCAQNDEKSKKFIVYLKKYLKNLILMMLMLSQFMRFIN